MKLHRDACRTPDRSILFSDLFKHWEDFRINTSDHEKVDSVTCCADQECVQGSACEKFLAEGCTVSDGTDIVASVRNIKSPMELNYIRRAAAIADIAHRAIASEIHGGMTELQVVGTMTRNGYQYRCIVTDARGNTATTKTALLIRAIKRITNKRVLGSMPGITLTAAALL